MTITKVSPGLLDLDSGITITTSDNSDNLTIVSTDAGADIGPNINFYRNSSSPADDDLVAGITFDSRNDNSQDIQPVRIRVYTPDVSDGTEDGAIDIATMTAGTLGNRFDILPTETVINNGSIDADFRVESNDNANALFVDGGTNVVGIGTNTPAIASGSAGLVIHSTTGGTGSTGACRLRFTNTTTGQASTDGVELSLDGNTSNFYIENREGESIIFWSGQERGRWRNGGGLCFNGDTAAANALDDYEEGSWTPVITSHGGSNNAALTATEARYTRIGALVYISAFLHGIDFSDLTDGTYVQIHGLPYATDADNYSPLVFGYNNTNIAGGYVEQNGFVYLNSTAGTEFQQQNNDITPSDGSARFMIGITLNLNV